MNGSYDSSKGISCYASYKYEGNVTSSFSRKITASASISYAVYVESASTQLITPYSFVTETDSCSGSVTILP